MKTAEELVDEVVRPLVAADGGTVEVVVATRERVHLRLGAACAGCPGKNHTRAQVIEPLFRSVLGDGVDVLVE